MRGEQSSIPDPPVREDVPERQRPAAAERGGDSVERPGSDDVERESVPVEGGAGGVETPSAPDRADLTP